jgi:photosystem II stability/assembly factor-like uncharacterized protein
MKYLFTILFPLMLVVTASAHFGSKGPFGGSVSCMIVYDTVAYVGTANGGVYFSTNTKLQGWSAKPVGLKSGKITALTHTGKYLFAGTADSGVFIYTGYVGTDRYWVKVNQGLSNLKVTSLVAIDSITVMAGTDGGGIFSTSDKGQHWTVVNNPGLHHYAITGLAKAGNRIIHVSDGGVYATDDKGASWIDFNDLNTDDVASSHISHNISTDEVMISNITGLYVASAASTTASPVYTSAQNGLPSNTNVYGIANDSDRWYLATDKGIYTSLHGTIQWIAANNGLSSLETRAILPYKLSLIAGTHKEGIFKSAATIIAWTANNAGYNNLETYSMWTSGVALVIAATEKGVFVSRDLAANYTRSNKGLTDSLHVNDLTMLNTKLYAATQNDGVFLSVDSGKTWSAFNTGMSNLSIQKVITTSSFVYAINAFGEVFQSDGTAAWLMIQNGLPTNVKPVALAIYGTKLLLGTHGDGIYTRDEISGTWVAANTGLTNLMVTSVTASGNKLFAGTHGSGVFVSAHSPINWSAAAPLSISHTAMLNLDGSKVQAMAFNAGYVFASYSGGLLASSDGGTTWIAGGNQFNLPSYTAVNKICFVTTRVFVTTENNGLYSNSLSELPVIAGLSDVLGRSSVQLTLSPNPTHGYFSINLKGIDDPIQSVSIFDICGRLMERIMTPQQLMFSVSYPKGVYFVQVEVQGQFFLQRLVIQ